MLMYYIIIHYTIIDTIVKHDFVIKPSSFVPSEQSGVLNVFFM